MANGLKKNSEILIINFKKIYVTFLPNVSEILFKKEQVFLEKIY